MKILLLLLVAFYTYISIRLFSSWMRFLLSDTDLTLGWTYLSVVIIITASLFWPLIVPFAYLELLRKIQQSKEAIETVDESTQFDEVKLLGIPLIKS